MANTDTEMSLEALHTAIRDQIAAQFPDLATVAFYLGDEDHRLPVPACLLELTDIEPAPENDAGTGQFPVLLRFQARLVLGHRDPSTCLQARLAAAALGTWLYQRRWRGVPADPCRVMAIYPDEFSAELDQFVVWTVEWQQPVFLGNSAWNNDGSLPKDLWISFAPHTGHASQDRYTAVTP
ncbi:MAG TPA: hypothetical protein ACQGQH_08520 [Xylella sp.]